MSTEYREYVAEIEHRLRLVAGTVQRRGRMLLVDYHVTPLQFDALIVLNSDGELTIGDLSNRLYLAYSTTTDLVDRLQKSNYVVRKRCLDDRRIVRVKLLEEGCRMIKLVMAARCSYLDTILSGVDSTARKSILDALECLNMNMADQ